MWHLSTARQTSITRRLRDRDMICISSVCCFVVGGVAFLILALQAGLREAPPPTLFLPLVWSLLVLEVTMWRMRCLWFCPPTEEL
jgi:hypothetical protein